MKEDFRLLYTNNPSPLYATSVGISYCDGTYHMKRGFSTHTVVEYILDGEGYVCMNGEKHLVTKDQIYILKSGIRHDYYSCAKNPWKKIFINLKGTLPLILLKEYGLADSWLYNGENLKPMFEKISSLISSQVSNEECQQIVTTMYMELLMKLHRTKMRAAHSKEAVAMKDFLDANYSRLVGNEELAAHIFHSADYCVKLFKKEYGMTPYNYQMEQKMTLACQILRQTDMSVKEVAASVGYNDTHYFSRLFKQKRGISPKAYKKQNSN
ncbi:MAG: helix-turn-helix domain-containing protein [Ruminococcaceae bacterium]|nr:helix-turn-helix domain-containing protein [Oscillospiraceae bacterium]